MATTLRRSALTFWMIGAGVPAGAISTIHPLDTTPGTTDLNDAPLLVGRTMTDPASRISFTTQSVSSSGVVVSVREGVAPSAPGSFSGTASDTPSAQLAWSAATDNVAVGSYRITRDGGIVASPAADATTWADSNVAFGATYLYAVAAVDTSGNPGPSVSASVTMPAAPVPPPAPGADPSTAPAPPAPPDPTPPPAPDSQTPSVPDPISADPSTTTVRLTWGAAVDDVGVAGYRVTRDGSPVATVGGTGWTDSGRAPRTTYVYTVSAVDAADHVSVAAAVTATTTADTVRPSSPRSFRRVSRSGRYVTFAWRAATDNVRVVRYKIFRVGRATAVASTGSTRIRIPAARGARYYVRAIDAARNRSAPSATIRGR